MCERENLIENVTATGRKTAMQSTQPTPKTIQGPAIFLAQFLGPEAPFNSLEAIARWAGGLGYKGVRRCRPWMTVFSTSHWRPKAGITAMKSPVRSKRRGSR